MNSSTEKNSSGSDRRTRKAGNESQFSSETRYTEGVTSSAFITRTADTEFQTPSMTETSGIMNSDRNSNRTRDRIRLMPVKIKDVMEMFRSNPAYRDKSPVMINMKENDIDQIIEQQMYKGLPASLQLSLQGSPLSVPNSGKRTKMGPFRPYNEEITDTSTDEVPGQTHPPLGSGQSQQVYAMTDIQAFPMIGSTGFKAHKRKRNKSPRAKSRRKVSTGRHVKRKARRRKPARSRSSVRPRSKGRPRKRKSRPRKVVIMRDGRKRSPVFLKRRRQPYPDPFCCTPFPMCDNGCCAPPPTYRPSRRQMAVEPPTPFCTCNMCTEKLQFIQPGVCNKKKNMWTNEYAIIPKPQVNLIDPCEELDSAIYPRADNPCIRDGRGNPLTDCIGRPLRDIVGKKFLSFSANGSVMDTNFRGNCLTGQPPLCVKCPLPHSSCAPDTTHNWWRSCGAPVMPDMSPYFKHVVAAEHKR